MSKIVISQPYFFPWVGLYEQIKLCDIFVHYDDVQFSKGSFMNRVQVKSPDGFKWMTIPLSNLKLGRNINEIKIDNSKNWIEQHKGLLKQLYSKTPFYKEMINLISETYIHNHEFLVDLLLDALEKTIAYYKLDIDKKFYKSSDLNIKGKSSDRVIEICKYFNCDTYITAMGALRYLNYEAFESEGIKVEFIDYKKKQYPQQFGEFNPFVSILDLIANTGSDGIKNFCSKSVYWKEFVTTDKAKDYIKKYNLTSQID